jgi:hypothetical protein
LRVVDKCANECYNARLGCEVGAIQQNLLRDKLLGGDARW